MRIAFYQDIWTDLCGPLLLAEILAQEGHEVRFLLAEKGWLKKLAVFSPQVVAFSIHTGNHNFAIAAAEKIKAHIPGPPLVIMGGPHPTFSPDILLNDSVDAICVGEGDLALPEFLSRVQDGGAPEETEGFFIKKGVRLFRNPMGPLVRNLDSLPIPTRKALYRYYPFLSRASFMRVTAGRGCPFSCSYCFNAPFRKMTKGKGPFIRMRSPGHVLEEIRFLHRKYGCRHIVFNDDVFTLNRKWFFRFAEKMSSLPLTYDCSTCASLVDGDVARALRDSGCRLVAMGVETGREDLRRDILKKDIGDEEIVRAARELHRAGVLIQTYNMIGFPGETLDDCFSTIDLNRRIRPFYAWCSIATPYPGTEFADYWTRKTGQDYDELKNFFERSYTQASLLPGGRGRWIGNLKSFFALAARFPFLKPLVRRLVHLPPNRAYQMLFQAVHGLHMTVRLKADPVYALKLYFRMRPYL